MKASYLNDLNNLDDIIDTFNIKKEDFKDTEYYEDFCESIYHIIDDFIDKNIKIYKEYNFDDIIMENIFEITNELYSNLVNEYDINLYDIISDCIQLYFYTNNCFRSYKNTTIVNVFDKKDIDKKLDIIKNKYQPEQRTEEWFYYRRNGLTASNIYKALGSESAKNSLIFEKCQPIKKGSNKSTNIDSAFHHGHLYEPLSIQIYETMYDTKIGEYGCIAHDKYEFLKASPDGINVKRDNDRYGRLLEVKNPKSRELSGIPKLEYWIQMQHQMECCNLYECDFIETIFKEYENEDDYKNGEHEWKGVILMFNDSNNEPYYEYPELNLSEKKFDKWYDKTMDKNEDKTWIRNIYWYLKDISIVLVTRNQKWYNAVINDFIKLWKTVEKERVTGYDHRKPKSKGKKINTINIETKQKNIKQLFNELPDSPKVDNGNVIIRVRTQSFDNK